MQKLTSEQKLLLALRLCLAWVFLYAASHQVLVKGWSIAGFLNSTKTFHWFYGAIAHTSLVPLLTFLVEYGHLLIGLSLLVGLFVRVSAGFGIFLMLTYWTAHMDFPYIGGPLNFLIDEHIVYALVLGLLIVRRAGHIVGLDEWVAQRHLFDRVPVLHWASA